MLGDGDEAILMDLGSVTSARIEISTRQQALVVEEEAAQKTSAPYRAPELTSTTYPCTVDERVDVWGLGCTLFCLAFGRSPFETAREGVLKLAILNGRYSVPAGLRMRDQHFSTSFVGIIKSMLDVDASKRPFASEVYALCANLLASSQ